jgi:hypothetical protein
MEYSTEYARGEELGQWRYAPTVSSPVLGGLSRSTDGSDEWQF